MVMDLKGNYPINQLIILYIRTATLHGIYIDFLEAEPLTYLHRQNDPSRSSLPQ